MVEEGVARLLRELALFQGVPAGREREMASNSFVREAVDLDAVVAAMERKTNSTEIELLAAELLSKFKPELGKVETFLARSPRQSLDASVIFGEAEDEMTLAILTPVAPADPAETRGLVAHEVAHVERDVSSKIFSIKPGLARRGEVLADLFALSSLGPAFAWALASVAGGSMGGNGSTSHPPMSLRFEVARGSLEQLWDEPRVREWTDFHLARGAVAAGAVPDVWRSDLGSCRTDLETSSIRLRSVKADESALLSLRGLGDSGGLRYPTARVTSQCPG